MPSVSHTHFKLLPSCSSWSFGTSLPASAQTQVMPGFLMLPLKVPFGGFSLITQALLTGNSRRGATLANSWSTKGFRCRMQNWWQANSMARRSWGLLSQSEYTYREIAPWLENAFSVPEWCLLIPQPQETQKGANVSRWQNGAQHSISFLEITG